MAGGGNAAPPRAPTLGRSHYADRESPSADDVVRALTEVVEIIGAADIPYVLMGGVGNAAMARPRVTDDIDLFVRPDDAHRILEALAAADFETEEHDPYWLYKAWKYGVLVDVIFRSTGDIYLDDEMLRRSQPGKYKGVPGMLIPPEDLIVIKAVAAGEATPHHWYDALGIIARCKLDWPYLVDRARQAGPRRLLSLLLYAESVDLAVPVDVVAALYTTVHPTEVEVR